MFLYALTHQTSYLIASWENNKVCIPSSDFRELFSRFHFSTSLSDECTPTEGHLSAREGLIREFDGEIDPTLYTSKNRLDYVFFLFFFHFLYLPKVSVKYLDSLVSAFPCISNVISLEYRSYRKFIEFLTPIFHSISIVFSDLPDKF